MQATSAATPAFSGIRLDGLKKTAMKHTMGIRQTEQGLNRLPASCNPRASLLLEYYRDFDLSDWDNSRKKSGSYVEIRVANLQNTSQSQPAWFHESTDSAFVMLFSFWTWVK
jgi:hypothetical protein